MHHPWTLGRSTPWLACQGMGRMIRGTERVVAKRGTRGASRSLTRSFQRPKRTTMTPMRPALLAAVLCALFATLALAGAGSARADEGWVIDSFDIVYNVQPDGSIEAKETIRADF